MTIAELALKIIDKEITDLKKIKFIYENRKILKKLLKHNKLKTQKLKQEWTKYL